MNAETISPAALDALRAGGRQVDLLDVRTPVEFAEVHATGARNVPLNELDCAQLITQRGANADPLYVICRSGGRARQACEKIAAAGGRAVNVEGGTLAWEAAGLPVVRGKKVMSLERQVRIAAGLLVLLSLALAYAVHPYFLGLAAFVGAGLIFAGITDFCGLGLLLARMPWNRTATPGAPCGRD